MARLGFFETEDYRRIIEDWLQEQPGKGHGERSKMARAAKCHTAYITHVLKGRAQFSPEQALRVSRYMGHSEEETSYFLALLGLDRAGSADLKALIRKDLDRMRKSRKELKSRLKTGHPLTLADQVVYYSKWYHTAVHVCMTVPALKTAADIARTLGITQRQVQDSIKFLMGAGLAQKKPDGSYLADFGRLHLQGDSPLIQKHHANWRAQAVRAVDRSRLEDLHYSSVVSMHPDSEPLVREVLVQAIEKVRELVRASPDPNGGVYSYCLDFFPVTGNDTG